ncbi:MAG: hypothetical protein AB1422_02745 [bacterium]
MKKIFSIEPVEGKKNTVEITFLKDFTLKVDKKDTLFVKFLMMMLHYSGGAASYFAPLLGFTESAFRDIKKKFETEDVNSIFYPEIEKGKVKELPEPEIGKIIALIVQNPRDTNKKIADKFNAVSSKTKISLKDVEKIREKFEL